MALEAELDRLDASSSRPVPTAREAVAKTHRQYRRDLVPVRSETLPLGGGREAASSSERRREVR